MTKQTKRKNLQRWKQMEALGATFLDKNGVRLPVRMREDALMFFRNIAKSYEHGQWIPVGSYDHRALDWLFSGHPSRDEVCPTGVQAFCVLVNNKGLVNNSKGTSATVAGSLCWDMAQRTSRGSVSKKRWRVFTRRSGGR